jgi:hypothetical protein
MVITEELLTARKEDLEKTRLQALAHLNAVLGAIEDVDHWLLVASMEAPEE